MNPRFLGPPKLHYDSSPYLFTETVKTFLGTGLDSLSSHRHTVVEQTWSFLNGVFLLVRMRKTTHHNPTKLTDLLWVKKT